MMISRSDAHQRVQENLTGFPARIVEAYLAFSARGDPQLLDEIVLSVLQFYLPKQSEAPLALLPRSTRLREDLGVDSLTMIDLVFLAENLFAIKLADDDLGRITTLGELCEHFRQRVGVIGTGKA